MRYGPIPTTLLELLALSIDKVPMPVLDTLLAPLQARALIAAVRAGVLQALSGRRATCAQLASECKVDADCLELLLRLLCAMSYVKRDAQLYQLTELGERHFGPRATDAYSAYVAFGEVQWRVIAELDRVLTTGLGVDFHETRVETDWELYQRAMLENARGFAGFLADHVPVRRGARRCLDLGGSHGLVGAELCRRHPGLASTVLDRAEALGTARTLAEQGGWADVVQFESADLTVDEFPPGQDVVLICNILHHFSEQTNLSILNRVRDSLSAGGVVAVFDIETPPRDAPPEAAGDGMALYFRITSNSRCLSGKDYASWLEQSGFRSRTIRSIKLPARVLVIGTAC